MINQWCVSQKCQSQTLSVVAWIGFMQFYLGTRSSLFTIIPQWSALCVQAERRPSVLQTSLSTLLYVFAHIRIIKMYCLYPARLFGSLHTLNRPQRDYFFYYKFCQPWLNSNCWYTIWVSMGNDQTWQMSQMISTFLCYYYYWPKMMFLNFTRYRVLNKWSTVLG